MTDAVKRPDEDYEYRGMVAEAWDLLRGDTSAWPDAAFWRSLIEEQAGPALDVGCGTGRLLLPFLAAGLDVDGVDNSPEMLALCRSKAATSGIDIQNRLFEQEMERLELPRRYATIFVPSLSILLLTDSDSAARAMGAFREHLSPGGMLALSFSSKMWPGRRTPLQMEWSDWYNFAEAARPQDGAVVRRWIRARYDHEQQLEHEENRYELLRDGKVVKSEFHARSPAVRWYSQAQALALFEAAGFTDLSVTSADSFAPAAPEDRWFKIRGRPRY
ncbi:MAG: class I SAM-dependent DNA methyltransferase [Caulobacteraceae bacterium]